MYTIKRGDQILTTDNVSFEVDGISAALPMPMISEAKMRVGLRRSDCEVMLGVAMESDRWLGDRPVWEALAHMKSI